MPLLETPPDSIKQTLRSLQTDGRGQPNNYALPPFPPAEEARQDAAGRETPGALRLSLAGDVAKGGSFGARWLTVDNRHLRVLTPGEAGQAAHVDLDVPLSEIAEAKTDNQVGVGALLLVMKNGETREAIRYTLGMAPRFSVAARAIEAYLKEEEPSAYLLQGLEKKVCPKCGDPLPDDTSVCPKCVDKRATLSRLMRYAVPYKAQAVTVTLLMFAGTALALAPPIFTKYLTDDVLVTHRHENWILWLVMGVILTTLAGVGLTIWRGRVAAWMSNHMVYELRTQTYNQLQKLSLSYYDKRQTGSLMARVTQDVNELQNFLVDGIQLFLVNTLTIVGVFVILLCYNWKLTLLVLIPAPVSVYLTSVIWKFLWGKLQRLWHLRSGLSGSINAALSGVRVVKAFAQESREAKNFSDRSYNLFGAGIVVEQAWATYFPIIGFVSTLGFYIIWYVGGLQVFHNPSKVHGMTIGVLGMFLTYVSMLLGPLQQMTRIADWLSRSTASAERVFEVIDAEPDIQDTPTAVAMPVIDGHVQLKNVHFSYDKNSDVLDDVSIDVQAGEMIGLVGHSGAGKSTIINLLSRFYDVKDGQILIDGVDIREIKTGDLRRQIGVVLQEPFLFPGTIASNISYAKPDATPAEIMRAAKAANAHDFIMRFPDGYDTYVGERGARLSGGERQRLSIARAILHDPRILILDEATASVDTETEKQIQEAITRLTAGRTTFAIAHRLSTLRNASRLMVMERGKLVEMGTHDELLAMPEGVFKKLVDMQQEVNKLNEV